ncbi:DUF4760 domain-containing protein [Stenotrophomonas riyadhensis]
MDKLGNILYAKASKLIAAAVVLAFVSFSIGAFFPKRFDQAACFKAAELFVWAAGLLSVLLVRRQLHAQEVILSAHKTQQDEAFDQLQRDHSWRCYAFYHQHFADNPSEPIRNAVYKLAQAEGTGFIECFNGRGRPIPDAALQAIIGSSHEWDCVRPYLDDFETFCGAINAKLVDEDYAFSLQATRVIRNYTVFEPLINEYKKDTPTAYCEFFKVAYRWKMRLLPSEGRDVEGLGVDGNGAKPIFGPKRRDALDQAA